MQKSLSKIHEKIFDYSKDEKLLQIIDRIEGVLAKNGGL
jgi:hypothetical protein